MKKGGIYFIVPLFHHPSDVAKAGTRLHVMTIDDREVGAWEITKANLV